MLSETPELTKCIGGNVAEAFAAVLLPSALACADNPATGEQRWLGQSQT
jgi:hypothetical protein